MEVIDRVRELAENYVAAHGIEIVDIIYRREAQGVVLRLLVDKPHGITLKECEDMNNYLSALLDKEEVIDGRYILEVSSPGLDRPIITDRDFERAMGKALNVTTYEPVDGRKAHAGMLIGMDRDSIVIESSGVSTVIPRSKIAKAVLRIEF